MPIISWMGATVSEYIADYFKWWDLALLSQFCPICNGALCWHSKRDRAAWTDFLLRADERILLLRVSCKQCKATHTLLPDFLTPHHRYQTPVREAVVTGEQAVPPCCAQTISRWKRAVEATLRTALHYITSWILTENATLSGQDQRFLTGMINGVSGLRQVRRIVDSHRRATPSSGLFGWVNREFGQNQAFVL
jgi:hypothetical protein